MNLFDTHTHLNDKTFFNNIAAVVARCLANGIKKMIVVGYDLDSSLKAIDLAYRFPGIIYAAVGIHPTECNDITPQDLERLAALLDESCVVALGEIGLDYHWQTVEPDRQKEIFIKQLKIAKEKQKPVIIHSREAIKDTYDILKQEDVASIGGVMHSFSSSPEMAKEFIKLKLFISISGVITFKNNNKTRQVVKDIPLEHLLLETDCPYLTPEPYRGQVNYPDYTYYVAEEIAKVKNLSVTQVIAATYENACQLFKITAK